MDKPAIQKLQAIESFEGLVEYLGDELDWPVADLAFEDLIFQYTPEEIGLDEKSAAVVTDIKRLRPLDDDQPWGIFFLELEPKKLPVVALRRLLNKMTLKQRATSNAATQTAWHADDILFISRFGESQERQLTFAHFASPENKKDLPVLKVLGWDSGDTALKMDHVAETLKEKLVWPDDPADTEQWREQWRAAFELKHKEVISTSKDMASRLAQLARGIRDSIQAILEVESEEGPLRQTMAAFKAALVDDLDEAGFADTYAQTITYGLLSARIADPTKNTLDDLAAHMRTNPFLKELMESFINLGGRERIQGGVGLDFDELGVSEVVDVLDAANMEAVIRDFGDLNPQEDPVIHFFEGFLQEYDKSIRKDRGVFYTPRPVVSFIVRSVDELLRTEFGLEDGLADTTTWGEMAGRIDGLEIPEGATADQAFVQILDPATGTGTFLVEVIDLIHKTMTAKWQAEGHGKKQIDTLWNDYVPEYLLRRLHGYELMMAPYAIAHMKIGLKLYETGYCFESDERARVYLTNALEPAQDFSGTLAFAIPALAHEAEAVNAIKRDPRFTVVIGNPPYFGEAGRGNEWIASLMRGMEIQSNSPTENYFEVDGEALGERNPKWLNDDYVKFMRLSDWHIERSGAGILSFITNHSYLDNPTFRGMRQSLMTTFNNVSVLDLHGNSKKKEVSPDGSKDENVFDIQQGVAICQMVCSPRNSSRGSELATVQYGEFWGLRDTKQRNLSTQKVSTLEWGTICPETPFYLFRIQDVRLRDEYENWWAVTAAMPQHAVGFQTHRDYLVISHSANELVGRITDFLDPENSEEDIRDRYFSHLPPGKYARGDTRDWKLARCRKQLMSLPSVEAYITKCIRRPFDFQSYFFHEAAIDYGRPHIMNHLIGYDNRAMLWTRPMSPNYKFSVFCSAHAVDQSAVGNKMAGAGGTYVAPLYLYQSSEPFDQIELEDDSKSCRSNLAQSFVEDIARSTGLRFSPQRDEYFQTAFGPSDVFDYMYAVFYAPSYAIRYSEFLNRDIPRIPIPPDAELFGRLASLGGELVGLHLLNSRVLDDFKLAVVGAGDFQVEKPSYSDETVWIDKAKTRGLRGVPEEVWNFQIGGYQVCERWLKDRQAKGGKNPRPGRILTDEDIEHYQKVVVALSETIRITAEIDEVIEAHGGWPGAFQTGDAEDRPASDVVYAEADDDTTQLDMVAEPKDG